MSKAKMKADRYPCGCIYTEDTNGDFIHYVMPGCRFDFGHNADCKGYAYQPISSCPKWVKAAIGHAFGYSDTGVFVGAASSR